MTNPSLSSFSPLSLYPNLVPYQNRAEAGRVLAEFLGQITDHDPLLLALPRGGVPVAAEIAKSLLIPLDIFLVRKFGLPTNPDIAIGTVTSNGSYFLDDPQLYLTADLDLAQEIQLVIAREQAEIQRREHSYRESRAAELITGRTVIVVDDGLTTGSTMRNAIRALRQLSPAKIIAAVPVASPEVCLELKSEADSVVCARTLNSFSSVRRCYRDFSPVLDLEIRNILSAAAQAAKPRAFHA